MEDLDPEQRMKPAILEFPEEEPFQDVEVDDEDYNPSLDPEEDEDETDEIKPERWVRISTPFKSQVHLFFSSSFFFPWGHRTSFVAVVSLNLANPR